jgi:nicotinamidase-related amidase
MTTNITPLTPSRTALLLMDFQPAVLAPLSDPDPLLARTATALSWARDHDLHHDDDIVVRKTRYGAFSTTGLRTRLDAAGIDTLILAGAVTGRRHHPGGPG